MKRIIVIFIIGLMFYGCETQPPVSAGGEITIIGADSVIAVNYQPNLSAIKKVPLVEDFANVSCMPCATSNKILESLIGIVFGRSNVATIKYPANFPSPNDPFYLANPTACNARLSYYNVYTAPCNIVDGILKPAPTDSNDVKTKINSRLLTSANVSLVVTDSIGGDSFFVRYFVYVKDTSAIDFSQYVCNVAVTETNITFASAPGANGETEFYDIMRVMFPTDKQTYSFNKLQNTLLVNQREVKISSTWNKEKLHAVVFLQNKSTKEVIQAATSY